MSTPSRDFTGQELATLALLAAVGLGAVGGLLRLGTPQHSGNAPFFTQVPGPLLAVFVGLGALGVAAALWLRPRLTPGQKPWRAADFTVVVLLGAVGSGWGGLYSVGVENPIPIFDWAFYAAPVALAGGVGARDRPDRVTLGVLAALPVGLLNTLGWSLGGNVRGALYLAAFSGGFGILVGLLPGLVGAQLGGDRPRPASE